MIARLAVHFSLPCNPNSGMRTIKDPVANFTVETLVAFIGALLVLPLLIKLILGAFKSMFRLRFIRRLLFDSIVVGATALLTREEVLDRIFGPRGNGAVRSEEPQKRNVPVNVRR